MARYSGSSWRSYRPNAAAAGAVSAPEASTVRIGTTAPCRILGLDPGSLRTGYGLIDCTAAGERHVANGCIQVRGGDFLMRLRHIFEAIAAPDQRTSPG